MPVDVIAADPALERHLIDVRLQLLQAQHIGVLAPEELATCPARARMPLTFQVAIFINESGTEPEVDWAPSPNFFAARSL